MKKNKKRKILIFPSGTEIAFEIFNALKYSKFVELYGGNSISSHADYIFKNNFNALPYVNDKNFVKKLNEYIELHNIEYVYPAHDDACLKLTQEQNKIQAKIITSDLKTVKICRSKNKTYEHLKGKDYLPLTFKNTASVSTFPIFIKPDVGQGSFGAKIIENKEMLDYEIKKNLDFCICEYLPGEEYTIDCFTDIEGKLKIAITRKRERIRCGIAVRSSVVPTDNAVLRIAEDINKEFSFNGAWFFQLKKDANGHYKLMEIAPRIPGTNSVSRNLGINFPLLTLYNHWGINTDIIQNKYKITVDRAFINRFKIDFDYDTVYLDFDDTFYIESKVNANLICFLYQCVNKNKRIILITKHKNNIDEAFDHFKVNKKLFSEIIHIDPNQDKSEFITSKNSIFIDDSFSERKAIIKKCNIPVFDLDMIESLIDWRL